MAFAAQSADSHRADAGNVDDHRDQSRLPRLRGAGAMGIGLLRDRAGARRIDGE
jgi:hypothetical protein